MSCIAAISATRSRQECSANIIYLGHTAAWPPPAQLQSSCLWFNRYAKTEAPSTENWKLFYDSFPLSLEIMFYLVSSVKLNPMTLYCKSKMITGMICEACIGIPAVHYTLLNHLFISLAYDGGPHETLPWPQSLQSS